MKTRTKLIALAGVAAASAYAVNKIKKTQDRKPVISAALPQTKTELPKVSAKSGLSKSVTASYKTQIAEMTKTMDPNGSLTLVHYIETDPKQGKEVEVLMGAAGYEIVVGSARTMYKKVIKSEAQTILDAVIYAAETAKSHKQKYLGWDFSE
jgi:hypothetical protein